MRRCVWSRNIKNGCSIYIYNISRLRVNHSFTYISCCSPQRDRSICRKIHDFVFFQGCFFKYYSCVKASKGRDSEYSLPLNAQKKLAKGVTVEVQPSVDWIGVADGLIRRDNWKTGLGDEVKGKTVIAGEPAVPQLVKKYPTLLNRKVHYRINKSPTLITILRQVFPVDIFTSCLFANHLIYKSVSLSVRPHGTSRLLLKEFSWFFFWGGGDLTFTWPCIVKNTYNKTN